MLVIDKTGRALVVVSGFALLLLLARCSPINPSVDKGNLIRGTNAGAQSGIVILKVRDTSGKSASASLKQLPDNLKSVELSTEKLAEFKADGRVKIRLTDLMADETATFAQASFAVTDQALELEGFEITVSAIDRETWVVAVQQDVDAVVSERIRKNLASLKLSFAISSTDEDVEVLPGSGPGKKNGKIHQ